MKLRHTFANTVGADSYKAQVFWCPEWQEYQVRLSINGQTVRAATYHTDWCDDATGTAMAMCKLPPEARLNEL
jgi:hypothetical protein